MSLSRSLMYYFQVRSLNSSHQTLHFSALEFFCFFQRTQISLNRFYQFLEVFSCAFFFSFSKFAFSFFLFLSEDVDLPESFYFFQRTQISLNFLLPFLIGELFPKGHRNQLERVCWRNVVIFLISYSKMRYHILWNYCFIFLFVLCTR